MIGVGVLAYRPLLDPLALHDQWYLLMLPLAVLLSLGYKAIRVPDRPGGDGRFDTRLFVKQGLVMSAQVIVTISLLYAGAILIVDHLLERIT